MRASRSLPLLLRVCGFVMALGVFVVFIPQSWMAACHRALGLGPFPADAIVDYLARSVSAFYAILGGVMLLVAGSIRRYAAVIAYLGSVFVLFGPVILVVDLRLDLPLWWTLGEGPLVTLMGAAILSLQSKARHRYGG